MYKYTSSRFKTRAEQEVKKAEHVARIGNAPLVQEGLVAGGVWGTLLCGQIRIQKKAPCNTQGQAVLLNTGPWPSPKPVPLAVFLPRGTYLKQCQLLSLPRVKSLTRLPWPKYL